MIPGTLLLAAWFALAIVTGAGLAYLAVRRYPVLLWPGEWLPAIRARRQIRKMTDPDSRIRS